MWNSPPSLFVSTCYSMKYSTVLNNKKTTPQTPNTSSRPRNNSKHNINHLKHTKYQIPVQCIVLQCSAGVEREQRCRRGVKMDFSCLLLPHSWRQNPVKDICRSILSNPFVPMHVNWPQGQFGVRWMQSMTIIRWYHDHNKETFFNLCPLFGTLLHSKTAEKWKEGGRGGLEVCRGGIQIQIQKMQMKNTNTWGKDRGKVEGGRRD